jgi:hypothetical protein
MTVAIGKGSYQQASIGVTRPKYHPIACLGCAVNLKDLTWVAQA